MTRHTVAALVLISAASGASAQASQLQNWFQTMDSDSNGQVTLADVQATKTKQFGRMDRNKDGTLTAAEVERVRNVLARRSPDRLAGFDQMVGGLDGNGDGVISKQEYVTTTPVFLAADGNSDNIVTKAEVSALASSN